MNSAETRTPRSSPRGAPIAKILRQRDLGSAAAASTIRSRVQRAAGGAFACPCVAIVIAAFISPYRSDRDRIRTAHREVFHEIWINAPLEVCEARDAKGLYKKARAGELKEFTRISAPYEPPIAPELEVNTHLNSVEIGREFRPQEIILLGSYARGSPRQSPGCTSIA